MTAKCVKMADDLSFGQLNELGMHIIDLSNRGLQKIEAMVGIDPQTIYFDNNSIKQIENLHHYDNLQRLSLVGNQLTEMIGVASLRNLTVLDLSNNGITAIQGLRNLTKLVQCNLSANRIRTIDNLNHNINLQHLDLSDNNIYSLSDIRALTKLKILLLHGNHITSVKSAPSTLPISITVLSLAENNISDLNEVSHLYHLSRLKQLSIVNNPCVAQASSISAFDYRPFVLNWCVSLDLLDGYAITEKEGLKAEWLYSQGRGRHFQPGQHTQLIRYLASICPLTASTDLDRAEDIKLNRVLQQQRLYQQQQKQEQQQQHDSAVLNIQAVRIGSELERANHVAMPVQHTVSPYRKIDKQKSSQAEHHSQAKICDEAVMQIEDVSSSDESHSVLESDSRYIPLYSDTSYSPLDMFTHDDTRSSLGSAASSPVKPIRKSPADKTTGNQDNNPSQKLQPRRLAANFNAEFAQNDVISKSPATGNTGQLYSGNMIPQQNQQQDQLQRLAAQQHQKLSHQQVQQKLMQYQQQHLSYMLSGQSPVSTPRQQDEPDSDTSLLADTSLKQIKGKLRKSSLQQGARRDSIGPTPVPHAGHRAVGSVHPVAYSPSRYTGRGNKSPHSGASSPREGGTSRRSESPATSLRDEQSSDSQASSPSETLRTLAATRLQAFWRGCRCRMRDPLVLTARSEIRNRRSEEHIRYLEQQLLRQSNLYNEERQIRSVQVEAIKQLCKEVLSLRDWRNQLEGSQDTTLSHTRFSGLEPLSSIPQSRESVFRSSSEHSALFQQSSITAARQLLEILSKSREVSPASRQNLAPPKGGISPKQTMSQPSTSSTSRLQGATLQKESELEVLCRSLQREVTELKQVLSSVVASSVDTQQSLMSSIVVPDICANVSTEDNASIPDLTAAGPRPQSGFLVLPPVEVTIVRVLPDSVLLHWQPPSGASATNSRLKNRLIIGYRVYLNGEPQGMVGSGVASNTAGGSHVAHITQLLPNHQYRVCLRTVSTLGESVDSAVLEFTTPSISASKQEESLTAGGGDYGIDSFKIESNQPSDKISLHKRPEDFQNSSVIIDGNRKQIEQNPPLLLNHEKRSASGGTLSSESPDRRGEKQVRSSSSYPLVYKKYLQGIAILDNKPEGVVISPKRVDGAREFFANTPPKDSNLIEMMEGHHGEGAVERGLSDEDLKFIPKPPEESLGARRNSLPRRNSLRRRSGPRHGNRDGYMAGNPDGYLAAVVTERVVDDVTARPSASDVTCRGREPGHSRESSADIATVRRSASLGAQQRVPRVVDKSGDKAKSSRGSGSSDSVRLKIDGITREQILPDSNRRASKSPSREKENRKASNVPSGGGVDSGIPVSHKRSSSDFSKPTRRRAVSGEGERSSFNNPGSPPRAPSSPTIRRSSSFSKAASTPNRDEAPQLRQAISLETLKAIKKSAEQGKPFSTAVPSTTPTSRAQAPPTQQNPALHKEKLQEPVFSQSKVKDKITTTQTIPESQGNSLRSSEIIERPFSMSRQTSVSASVDVGASVQNSANKKSDPVSKQKLGQRATMLFAQLQKKITTNNK